MGKSELTTAGVQAGTVALGYSFGLAIGYPGDAPSIYTFCAAFAAILMLGDILVGVVGHAKQAPWRRNAICVATLLYLVIIVCCEPFYRVHTFDEIVVAALVLTPLLLAIGYLVRAKAWMSVAGVSLLVFSSSAMIASNANASVRGSGFFRMWVA